MYAIRSYYETLADLPRHLDLGGDVAAMEGVGVLVGGPESGQQALLLVQEEGILELGLV